MSLSSEQIKIGKDVREIRRWLNDLARRMSLVERKAGGRRKQRSSRHGALQAASRVRYAKITADNDDGTYDATEQIWDSSAATWTNRTDGISWGSATDAGYLYEYHGWSLIETDAVVATRRIADDELNERWIFDALNVTQATGGPAAYVTDRTDGKIGSLHAGGSNVAVSFDDSGNFQVVPRTRANIEARSYSAPSICLEYTSGGVLKLSGVTLTNFIIDVIENISKFAADTDVDYALALDGGGTVGWQETTANCSSTTTTTT